MGIADGAQAMAGIVTSREVWVVEHRGVPSIMRRDRSTAEHSEEAKLPGRKVVRYTPTDSVGGAGTDAAQALAELLTPAPADITRLLQRLVAEGKGKCIDVGGLRGIWLSDRVVIEAYERIQGIEPKDLL